MRVFGCWSLIVVMWLTMLNTSAQMNKGKVELTVVEASTGLPVPCRVHLADAAGKPVRPDPLPFWRDHFVCPGKVQLELPTGEYRYEIERGPEYEVVSGMFTIKDGGSETTKLVLKRFVELKRDGWWSGELHVHRPLQDVELLMQAEDLHVAPVITWWNNRNLWATATPPRELTRKFDGNRYYNAMAGEDEREGGALLFFGLSKPIAITGASREYPAPMRFVTEARKLSDKNVRPTLASWIDIEKPFWWDMPVWVALAQPDSIGLANNHMCRSQMYETEAWGKPRDTVRLPPPTGNGYWSQEIYYHLLNCGIRIPPSAGSASGVLPNPVGYNRVYVKIEGDFTYEKWWDGLRAGRSFVTNGPLLRVTASGKIPGHVFTAREGNINLQLKAALTSRDPVNAIEIIKNGTVERTVPVSELAKANPLNFSESGWFLVRAIAENPKTFRFASSAPFYVEIGNTKQRISKSSAQFFLDWVRERMERVKIDDPAQREEVLRYHTEAEQFWRERLSRANSE